MPVGTCKEICKNLEFILNRSVRKSGYHNACIYTDLTKYCSTCEYYIDFLNEDEFNTYISCPCCHHRYRVRPQNSISKASFKKRVNRIPQYIE